MALSDIQIPYEEIDCLGTTIRLRPLALTEAADLLARHAPILAQAWDIYAPQLRSNDDLTLQGAGFAFVGHCADAIAELIAICAGEPDKKEIAASLPIDVQFRVAITIYRLTLAQADPTAIVREFHDAMQAVAQAGETAH